MANYNGNALDALREALTIGDTVQPSTGGALAAGTTSASADYVRPSQGTLTNRSGTITAGDTAQTLMAANADRKYLLIQNISDTVMWFNFTTTAVKDSPSFMLGANGGTFVMEGSYVSTEAISIICVTTGKKFTAKEG
jgi:hypothetical protein